MLKYFGRQIFSKCFWLIIGCQTIIVSPPSPEKTIHVRKKMKTPTGSPFNSTSLLKSPVVSVPSNGATNNLKKEGRNKKRTQKLPNICKFGVGLFDASMCDTKLR